MGSRLSQSQRTGVVAAGDIVSVRAAQLLVGLLLTTLGVVAYADEQPSGAALFRNHCAACHGERAEGNGPAAVAMNATVPGLRTLADRNGGVFPADAVARHIDGRDRPAAHGSMQMPVWGEIFKAPRSAGGDQAARERIAALVEHIETLQD
jgi:mono/diheme cytochrome c family protein